MLSLGCGSGSNNGGSPTRLTGHLTTSDAQADSGHYFDIFEATGRRNGQVTVEVDSEEMDAAVLVLDEDLDILASDHNDGEGMNARLQFNASEGRLYYISVTSFDSYVTGEYRLRVSSELHNVNEWDGRSHHEALSTLVPAKRPEKSP